jgi:hypothetical protein
VKRALYVLVYGGFAALGEALVARPAAGFVRGLGLFRAALPWEVPLGALAALVALLLAALALLLAVRFGLGLRPRISLHAGFLLLLALALAVRAWSGEPSPPRDPTPVLLDGLRTVAEALDRSYAGSYVVDPAALDAALSRLPPLGFRRNGRLLSLRVRLERDATGARKESLPGDEPGTIYVALSADAKRAWISALTLRAGAPAMLRSVVQAAAGTHSVPGRDPLIPAYPGMRTGAGR